MLNYANEPIIHLYKYKTNTLYNLYRYKISIINMNIFICNKYKIKADIEI